MKKLVMFCVTDAAELAHYYFCAGSDYQVAVFSVGADYIKADDSESFVNPQGKAVFICLERKT